MAVGFFHYRNEEKMDQSIFGLKFLLKNAAFHRLPNQKQTKNSICIYLGEKELNAFSIQYERIKRVG